MRAMDKCDITVIKNITSLNVTSNHHHKSLHKVNSAPELPPISGGRPGSGLSRPCSALSRPGSGLSRTGGRPRSSLSRHGSDISRIGSSQSGTYQTTSSGHRAESCHERLRAPSADSTEGRQRSSSFPAVQKDGRLANAKSKASYAYNVHKRRVSLIIEDPQNELPSAPPSSPTNSPKQQRRGRSRQASTHQQHSTTASRSPSGPFHDPDWQDYLSKAKGSKMKQLNNINTHTLYNLDPQNINRSNLHATKPTNHKQEKVREIPDADQTTTVISEEKMNSLVHPVDTDFRIMKWIKDCEDAGIHKSQGSKNNL